MIVVLISELNMNRFLNVKTLTKDVAKPASRLIFLDMVSVVCRSRTPPLCGGILLIGDAAGLADPKICKREPWSNLRFILDNSKRIVTALPALPNYN